MTNPVNPLTTPDSPPESVGRLIRLSEVEKIVGLKRSAIYKRIADGSFPACVKLGLRASAWSDRAIHAWVATQIRRAVNK
jgi:prophage regulatory protein